MRRLSSVEILVSVRAINEKTRAGKDVELLLDSVKRKKAESRQFPHKELRARIGEEQSQNFRSPPRKQCVQHGRAHRSIPYRRVTCRVRSLGEGGNPSSQNPIARSESV